MAPHPVGVGAIVFASLGDLRPVQGRVRAKRPVAGPRFDARKRRWRAGLRIIGRQGMNHYAGWETMTETQTNDARKLEQKSLI